MLLMQQSGDSEDSRSRPRHRRHCVRRQSRIHRTRGFLTGSTDTSLWTIFKNGIRNYCGNTLPDGAFLVKNQRLFVNILTPTTKAIDHDVPVTPNEIVQRGFMNQADLEKASKEIIKERNYN
ncbi:hypothetical protein Leryth_023844 [Lithospermum erythrorhizon]|nr:hypothetical protein Leryth_023844 [Lithospermum erythrorhizon]